jgi:hypothetical protein
VSDQQSKYPYYCSKLRHETLEAAERHCQRLERRQRQEVFTYLCRHCGFWHVGHSARHGVYVPPLDRLFHQLGLDEQENSHEE